MRAAGAEVVPLLEDSRSGGVHRLPLALQSAIDVAKLGLKASLQVEVENLPDVPVLVSQSRLEQVMVNLLINAQHAVEDRPVRRVVIRCEVHAEHVLVHVDDSGAGIAAADLDRVFEPFYTTKERGSGMGLGLPLSRSYLQAMGGDLVAGQAALLGGARLTLRLARMADDAILDENPSLVMERRPAPDAPVSSERVQRARLLVVDDEPALRRSLSRALGDRWEVLAAENAEQAMQALRTGPFDVLLCDLVLRNEDGIDVLRRVAAVQPDLLERTVLMTG